MAHRLMNIKTDVLIIGGGPGGAAAAMFLIREGIKPIVLEQETFPRFYIGESMTIELVVNSRDDARNSCCGSPCCYLYVACFSSCIAKVLGSCGSGRIMGSSADPRGKQRLRPLEVVRYSDVDEESRANQSINSAIEQAGKDLSLQ
jgi:choline dehydrogenase-like flavoprotein